MKIRTKIRARFILLDMLDLLEDAFVMLNRPGMGRMQRYWGYAEMRTAYRTFERWEAERYLEAQWRGDDVVLKLSAKGKELLEKRRPSAAARRRRWDGRWRMVVFDFPEVARKARDVFRLLLREHRMACLQKSVWITPDPVISEWKTLLRELELTDWVLLFESAELGPVDDHEIAAKVWRLDKLDQEYNRYLTEFEPLFRQLRSADHSALDGELGKTIRRESKAYFRVLSLDPVLPGALLPSGFKASQADELHQRIRATVRNLIAHGKP